MTAETPPADAEALARLEVAKELDDARHRVRLAFEKGNATYLYADIDKTMAQAAAQLRASHAQEAALREENQALQHAWMTDTVSRADWESLQANYDALSKAFNERDQCATALERQLEEARAQGQQEGRNAVLTWLRERSAQKPRASLWSAAEQLADQYANTLIPGTTGEPA